MRVRDRCLALAVVVAACGPGVVQAGAAGRAARGAAEGVIRRLWRGSAAKGAGALVARHGDDAARALIRHGRLAGPVAAAVGSPAARALAALSPRNARRLAMMTEAGELARIGRAAELLGVVGRYGDRALDFVWRHKGALAVSAALATFLADPAPFLDGSRELAGVAATAAVGAVAGVPVRVAAGAAGWPDWPVAVVSSLLLVTAAVTLKAGQSWRRAREANGRRDYRP